MRISGKTKKEVKQAIRLYKSFREKHPKKIKVVSMKTPKAVAVVGYIEYVGYKTTHGKRHELYQHDFSPGSRPLLCVSADGKQLLLLGGRYKFTGRGIVDTDARGRQLPDPGHGEFISKSKLPAFLKPQAE